MRASKHLPPHINPYTIMMVDGDLAQQGGDEEQIVFQPLRVKGRGGSASQASVGEIADLRGAFRECRPDWASDAPPNDLTQGQLRFLVVNLIREAPDLRADTE
jgi:hypothetical protein